MNEQETPDLVNLMEWNRFAEEKKTLLEALTILNNRHREAVSSIERERDGALAKLSTVYRWIEKNSGDGFIDSQTHVQNLQRISDYWYDRLEEMSDELQKVCQQRDAWAMRCDKIGVTAMREAIKDAHKSIKAVPIEYDPRFFRAGKWSEEALAKLQPFLA